MKVIRAGNTDPNWQYPEHLEKDTGQDVFSEMRWLFIFLMFFAVVAAIISFALVKLDTPYVAYRASFPGVVFYVTSLLLLILTVASYIFVDTPNTVKAVMLALALFTVTYYFYLYSVISVRDLTVVIMPFVIKLINSDGYCAIVIDLGQVSAICLAILLSYKIKKMREKVSSLALDR